MSILSPASGLSQDEARQRLEEYGLNEIRQEKSRPLWRLVGDQFASPLVLILILACVLSAVLKEFIEAVAIGAILVLNALIGFFQEYRAETAISALREMTAPRATVLRDARQSVVLAHDIVPGDLLLLEAGDIVAADGELVTAARLQINEALLTGESLAVAKAGLSDVSPEASTPRSHQVFMGTSVVTGTATVRVTATGMNTELGHIAHLMATASSEPTPLQVQLSKVGRTLLGICLAVVGVVILLGLKQGQSWIDVLVFSVSLAVAAVPEGMPAIVTVALALGVQRLAARHALIRKLPSVETLGSVSIICTDKTGTLTTGKMRVREIWGEDHAEVSRTAASCCDAALGEDDEAAGSGDPTELAILREARERGLNKDELERDNPRISSEPFDAERRRMSILRQDGKLYVKGAVENILPLCISSAGRLEQVSKVAGEMSSRGLRVLAVAQGTGAGEKNLHLVGLLGMADPPRTEAAMAIREARNGGVTPIMITGDHPQTAVAIAKEIGLLREGESDSTRVHARATPQDKLELVRAWKARGHIVAMTGDGVNDAPALREAHVGIAMGQAGTEVTRQAADLILADDNFATIVAAIREGRSIFQNIRRAISYLLTGNLAEILIVLGAIVCGLPLPLLAAQLLWINLVTDALPALTLIAEPTSPDIMKRPPRSPQESLLGSREWGKILAVGLLESAVCLGLYAYLLTFQEANTARSILFTTLVFSQLLRSFAARSTTKLFWEVGALSNLWLLGVVLISAFLQFSLHHIPLARELLSIEPIKAHDFLFFILPAALVTVTAIECQKLIVKFCRHKRTDGDRQNP